MRKKSTLLIFVFIVLLNLFSFAEQQNSKYNGNTNPQKDIKTEIKDFINHHLQDTHDFHLTKGLSFPLPVILWDSEFQVFSSSKFHHGEVVAEHNENYYKLYHGKIYKTDREGTITYDENNYVINKKPLDFSITKNVCFILIVSLLMMWMFKRMAKSYKTNPIPTGVGRFLEPIILYVRDDIARPNIGEKNYKRYMNFLLTVFFFIWIINLFGLTPLGVNVTNNIAVTFSLAIMTYLITTFTANKNYWKHIFWMPGVPAPMKLILAPIELLGTIIKPFSLMIRLYANITAGHVVLMSIIGLMFIFKNWIGSPLSFGLAFALALLELLVAALQAYIFTMLSALYFGSAVEEHHDH